MAHTAFTRRACIGALAALGCAAVRAQDSAALRIIVAAPPGGITDSFARLMSEPLAAALGGRPVIVENRPGGSGLIAVRALQAAPADGQTLYFATPTSLTLPPLLKTPPPFDVARDTVPVMLVASGDGLLVVPTTVPVQTVQELVAYAKARPGQLNYGSAGIASTNHLAMALFADRLGLDLLHVPYTGAAPAVNALLGGQLQVYMGDTGSLGAHVKAGKLRALAQIGLRRDPQYPDVPTLHETVLPGYRASFWLGLVARAGTPASAVERINLALNQALAAPAVKAHVARIGFALHGGAPQELAHQFASDAEVWGTLIRKHGITAP